MPVLTPCARAMRAFDGGGADGQAGSVERNQSRQLDRHDGRQQQRAGTRSRRAPRLQQVEHRRVVDQRHVGPPMMRRLIEYSAIIIRMLASRSMILRLTLSQPVISRRRRAAVAPAMVHPGVGAAGDQNRGDGAAQRKAAIHREVGKRSRPERNGTPRATRLKIRPISSGAEREKKRHGASGAGEKQRGRLAGAWSRRAGRYAHARCRAGGDAATLTTWGRLDQRVRTASTPCFSAAPG